MKCLAWKSFELIFWKAKKTKHDLCSFMLILLVEYQLMFKFITMQVLLVTGGLQWSGNSSIPLDSTEILETNTWRISAPLPSARIGLKAAGLGNTIFLFGKKISVISIYIIKSNIFKVVMMDYLN